MALGPIAFASLVVLLVAWYSAQQQPPRLSSWNGTLPTAPEPTRLAGMPTPTPQPLNGQFSRRTDLDITSADGLFDEAERSQLGDEVETALNYVSERFGNGPQARISAYFGWEENCGLHGIAYTEERTTQVFTCPTLPRERAVNIMAHEFVHQLAHDRYGERHLHADMILLEGIATWGAGSYWLGGQPSFRALLHSIGGERAVLPLATSYIGRSVGDMNTLYYQWASFVEYLIESYGRERFDALYITGNSEPGSADYQGTYGKSLAQLEQEWLAWIGS